MSEQTHDALAQAIQNHIADQWEGDDSAPLLTDWVLAAAAVSMDDGPGITSYSWWSNGGPQHGTVGLATLLGQWVTDEADDEQT